MLVTDAQCQHACLRSSMTTRLSQAKLTSFWETMNQTRTDPCLAASADCSMPYPEVPVYHVCHPQRQVKKLSPDFKRWPACRTCSALASCPLFFSRASSTFSPSSSPWGLSGSFKRQPDLLDLYQGQIQPQPQPQNQHQHQHQNQHQHQHQTTTSLSASISTSTPT